MGMLTKGVALSGIRFDHWIRGELATKGGCTGNLGNPSRSATALPSPLPPFTDVALERSGQRVMISLLQLVLAAMKEENVNQCG